VFENLIKEINALKHMKFSIPIQLDKEGYMDKECPNKKCMFIFKVNGEDWENKFKDEAVYCPMCRHEAPSNEWFTTKQIAQGREQAIRYVRGKFSTALRQGATDFNARQPRKGFIRLSVKFTGGDPEHFFVPIKATAIMERKVKCKACDTRYAVIGNAFFVHAVATIRSKKHLITAWKKLS
jgi:hypothetical protein